MLGPTVSTHSLPMSSTISGKTSQKGGIRTAANQPNQGPSLLPIGYSDSIGDCGSLGSWRITAGKNEFLQTMAVTHADYTGRVGV